MSTHNTVETVLGGVVLAVAGIFLAVALSSASFKQTSGYTINANFSKADGINPGMDVKMSGVKVGSVSNLALDPKTYLAKVQMTIQNDIQLPVDTVAKVASESILGGKYLTLEPGGDDAMIKDGGQIQYTQAAVNLEELLGKFIFNGDDKDKKAAAANAAPTDAAPAEATAATPAADKAQPFAADY
jgi:phospholipid/cholesterol/gamma-HCH transport system substrate-binding protein